MMSNYGLTIDSNCIVGIMTPFWVCKKKPEVSKSHNHKEMSKSTYPYHETTIHCMPYLAAIWIPQSQ
jgi:hypothetical protein